MWLTWQHKLLHIKGACYTLSKTVYSLMVWWFSLIFVMASVWVCPFSWGIQDNIYNGQCMGLPFLRGICSKQEQDQFPNPPVSNRRHADHTSRWRTASIVHTRHRHSGHHRHGTLGTKHGPHVPHWAWTLPPTTACHIALNMGYPLAVLKHISRWQAIACLNT